jgi:hypothetical protein
MGEAALKSAQLGEDALNFYKTIYTSDLAPLQRRQQELAERVSQSFMEDSALARETAKKRLAEDDANKPLRERVVSDAMGYDSDQEINKQMGIAAANVNQQFSNALGQKARMESRYGRIGGSFGDTNNALLAQASAASGLMTNAARETKDRAIALRAGANEAMSGRANTGGQFLGIAGNSLSGAMGAGSSVMGDVRANAGVVGQGFNTSLAGYGQAANIYGQEFQGRMQGYNAQMQAISGLAGAAGTYYGLRKPT